MPRLFPRSAGAPPPPCLRGWREPPTVSGPDLSSLFLAWQLRNAHANAARGSRTVLPQLQEICRVSRQVVPVRWGRRLRVGADQSERTAAPSGGLWAQAQPGPEQNVCSHRSRRSATLQRKAAAILRAGLLRKGVVQATRTDCPCSPTPTPPSPFHPLFRANAASHHAMEGQKGWDESLAGASRRLAWRALISRSACLTLACWPQTSFPGQTVTQ